MKTLPTKGYLLECLEYDADDGFLFWKERPASHFISARACNIFKSKFSGKKAGSKVKSQSGKSYRIVRVNGESYLAHRIIWKMVFDSDPDCIDHINGNGMDNRILNLRSVNVCENAKNARKRKDNKSGVVGVGYMARDNVWRARISINGKTVILGHYKRMEDAVIARRRAEIDCDYHKNHGADRPDRKSVV